MQKFSKLSVTFVIGGVALAFLLTTTSDNPIWSLVTVAGVIGLLIIVARYFLPKDNSAESSPRGEAYYYTFLAVVAPSLTGFMGIAQLVVRRTRRAPEDYDHSQQSFSTSDLCDVGLFVASGLLIISSWMRRYFSKIDLAINSVADQSVAAVLSDAVRKLDQLVVLTHWGFVLIAIGIYFLQSAFNNRARQSAEEKPSGIILTGI